MSATENSETTVIEQGREHVATRRHPNLKPFRKGTSGNPGGRPAISAQVRLRAQEATPSAIERIVALIDSDDERVALMACKEILDRAYGKVGQADKEDDRDRQVTINLVQFGEELRDTNERLRDFGSNCE
jgi:hypothetical protein